MWPRAIKDVVILILEAIILAYLILNVAAFALFGFDKGQAIGGRWRIKERTLLLVALLGPFGAMLGMRLFHHKTKLLKFKLVPIFLLVHIALIIYIMVNGVHLV